MSGWSGQWPYLYICLEIYLLGGKEFSRILERGVPSGSSRQYIGALDHNRHREGISMTEVTTQLNSVEIGKVASLAAKIQEEPSVAETKWSAEVNWKGGFRSEAKIRDFSPTVSDEPPSLGGSDTGPNPVEQVLAALGNCLAVGYAAGATMAGIKLNNLSIKVDGDLDLHTFLGLKDGNAGFSNILVSVDIDSDASSEALQELHKNVTATSPVGHTLSRSVPVDIKLA
ncbi:MAG: OsmC family protein [Rhizobiaceae bacterium]|nr:OsmC family protein [Rhizobiaceae bacterium]